jgi:hypothetical protein
MPLFDLPLYALLTQFAAEIKFFGVDVHELVLNQQKPLILSEYGELLQNSAPNWVRMGLHTVWASGPVPFTAMPRMDATCSSCPHLWCGRCMAAGVGGGVAGNGSVPAVTAQEVRQIGIGVELLPCPACPSVAVLLFVACRAHG